MTTTTMRSFSSEVTFIDRTPPATPTVSLLVERESEAKTAIDRYIVDAATGGKLAGEIVHTATLLSQTATLLRRVGSAREGDLKLVEKWTTELRALCDRAEMDEMRRAG